ncbi:hypothetical protein LCGC14_2917400, partial [marine sediment metagenome]
HSAKCLVLGKCTTAVKAMEQSLGLTIGTDAEQTKGRA